MSRMISRYIVRVILLGLSVVFLSGCSVFQRDLGRASTYSVTEINSVNDMQDMSYYVKKDENTYHELYIGNTTFSKKVTSHPTPSRVAWFGKDFDKIPTMYRGESLVFYAKNPFREGIHVERFRDTGFTIGIANLKKTETGRFSFHTSPDKFNLDINSSAGQMYELGDHIAILDMIGQAKLREGNVTESGTIIGLSEGKTYSTYVYIGTNAHHYNIVADVRALVSTETTRLWDYEFTKDKTIEFSFPASFNSGYYFISDFGMVRYVNGDRVWDETIDMNIPNVYRTEDGGNGYDEKDREGSGDSAEQYIEAQNIETIPYTNTKDGRYLVTINYETGDKKPAPTAKIIGANEAFTLELVEEGRLQGEYDLEAGNYEIQIVGINNRVYTYKIEEADKD